MSVLRLVIVAGVLMPSILPAASAGEPGGERLILATGSFWRCYYVLRPPVLRKGDGIEKVRAGIVSIEEILRTAGSEMPVSVEI